ncbi:hypothetical protein DQ04_13401000 [Trypanosoma grayi]|uniref:hypothetical protein n=1 Tax=Trypanosoma grayi TaxID=71804 RepID=UPI0004F457A5|nr:hypothetical protein DQ04_13401000 [Trypanosoma grayi]KEG06546.1 hypothetical protein DQ04_13401000 [Trypanosoma grayi]
MRCVCVFVFVLCGAALQVSAAAAAPQAADTSSAATEAKEAVSLVVVKVKEAVKAVKTARDAASKVKTVAEKAKKSVGEAEAPVKSIEVKLKAVKTAVDTPKNENANTAPEGLAREIDGVEKVALDAMRNSFAVKKNIVNVESVGKALEDAKAALTTVKDTAGKAAAVVAGKPTEATKSLAEVVKELEAAKTTIESAEGSVRTASLKATLGKDKATAAGWSVRDVLYQVRIIGLYRRKTEPSSKVIDYNESEAKTMSVGAVKSAGEAVANIALARSNAMEAEGLADAALSDIEKTAASVDLALKSAEAAVLALEEATRSMKTDAATGANADSGSQLPDTDVKAEQLTTEEKSEELPAEGKSQQPINDVNPLPRKSEGESKQPNAEGTELQSNAHEKLPKSATAGEAPLSRVVDGSDSPSWVRVPFMMLLLGAMASLAVC